MEQSMERSMKHPREHSLGHSLGHATEAFHWACDGTFDGACAEAWLLVSVVGDSRDELCIDHGQHYLGQH